MKAIFATVFVVLIWATDARAQFYYRDIISTNQLSKEMTLYRENKVHTVTLKSFEDDGSESEGFFCEKKISRDYRRVELFTRSDISATSLFTSWFNDKGQLTMTDDSSSISVTVNTYSYDQQGRVQSILSSVRSSDDDFVNEILEEHLYKYGSNNLPEKMTRIKNKYDSTVILFSADANNNISIEKNTKDGSKYYYYYDAKNRLTDVVHANEYSPKLTAEYLFEYNASGQVSQMTTTEEGSSDYFIWKYTYNNGLRTGEKCYSKQRRLLGSIQYEYK